MLNRGEDLSHMTPEERRKYLRNKIRNKKKPENHGAMKNQLKNDPTGALLSMGIDDPTILANAKSLVKNPEAALANVKSMLGDSRDHKTPPANVTSDSSDYKQTRDEDDDEDLPPVFPAQQ